MGDPIPTQERYMEEEGEEREEKEEEEGEKRTRASCLVCFLTSLG